MKCKLRTLAAVKGGKRLPKGTQLISTPNSHPYIRVRDLKNQRILELNSNYEFVDNETQKQITHYTVHKGDIILSIVGTIGLVAIVGESLDKANLSENCAKIITSEKIDNKYLYYYLKSHIGQAEITRGTVGAVQLKLPIKNIEDIDVWVPPKNIQLNIASILSHIDDKIEINKKINNNLQQQASMLFDYWFITPTKKNVPISNNWRKGALSDIAFITSGKRPPMKQTLPTTQCNIPIVGAASIMGYTNAVLYNEPILVTGRVGTHGIIQRFQVPCWASDNTLVIKSHFYEYTHQVLKRIDYKNINRGSTQPLITQTDLGKTPIFLPEKSKILEFEKITATLMAKCEANRKENECLSALRDAILPRLLSGEIDILAFSF